MLFLPSPLVKKGLAKGVKGWENERERACERFVSALAAKWAARA